MRPRLLVLAIDAADPALIANWTADGTMPALQRLMHGGISGHCSAPEGFYVGSTWPSFFTGTSPAQHGHHSLLQLRPGSYDYYEVADDETGSPPPFWDHLSEQGRRVAVLDVPLSRLSTKLHGVQSVEWGSHDAMYGFRAQPAAFQHAIESRFGAHPLGPTCDAVRKSAAEYRSFVQRLVRGAQLKAELTRYVLSMEPWDFAMQVFTEAHCAGHQCWHLHDPSHPCHDGALATGGDPLRDVYRSIDSAIGAILQGHDDTTVVVMSAHGMSWWFGAQFLLRPILVRLGVTMPLPTAADGTAHAGGASLYERAAHALPPWARRALRPLRDAVRARAPQVPPTLGVDAAASLCFPVHNGLAVGGVRLNLVGREPHGRIEPGQAADEFCAGLADELLALRDAQSGRLLVRSVRRTAQLYRGARLDHLPDLLVEWNDDAPTGSAIVGAGRGAVVRATSPRIGVVEGTNRYGRTGEHRPVGFFTVRGPGIAAKRLERDVSLLDFAPTFCAMLGASMPQAEGRVIGELTGEFATR